MKYSFTIILVFFVILSGCTQTIKTAEQTVAFQQIIDKKAQTTTGILLAVLAPDLDLNWQGAAGFDSKTKEHELSSDQPFRIASITKTFTAVSILRLSEMGALNIDDPIDAYISQEHKDILLQDKYDLSAITIKHCLQHTSGLFDYAVGNNDYVMTAMEDPNKRWTRAEQIQFAIDHGDPVGKPGEIFHYSDTAYVLLGAIIERLTGKGLAQANRELINFDKIGLTSTWLESLEPAPEGMPTKARSYLDELDATDWDNSVDLYGGGGYVATAQDLAKFYHHLFNDNIFEKPETLAIMLSDNGITNQGSTAAAYKMGLWEIKTPNGSGFMHNGFWGSAVIHFPDYNATIGLYYIDNFNNDVMKAAFDEIVKRTSKD
ncbi:MAG: serine hydrolase domain-containing protein [Gilvibacter sp.]